jgi:WD40 repeat protein
MLRRCSIFTIVLATAAALATAAPAAAATPATVWTAPGMSGSSFSVDGSLTLTSSSSAGGRLEVRHAGTGTLIRAITSPIRFSAAVLAPNNQTVIAALTDTGSGLPVRVLRVYRIADGALVRSISTAATRDITSVDISPDATLVAAADPRNYSTGGNVHVHRIADGTTVALLTVPATTAAVRFSADGRQLAVNDRFTVAGRFVGGVRVFRTSDWTSVLTLADNSQVLRWSGLGAGLWVTTVAYASPTLLRLVSVPTGAITRSVTLQEYDSVSDVSNDDTLILSGRWAAPRRSLKLSMAATGTAIVTFDFAADVFAGDIRADGSLFSYALNTAPSAYDVYVGRVPS